MRKDIPVISLSAALLFGVVVAGCGGSDSPSSSTTPSAGVTRTYESPPAMAIDPAKTYTATIETSKGTIVANLDPVEAPKTVNNFVFLARNKFYDGLTFHRVVADFVIQGGDPQGNGRGGPGYTFADELPKSGYKIGDLAMANSGPGSNTNGSQFFIISGKDGAKLAANYSRFGHVTAGLEVAKAIEALADPNASPGDPSTQKPTEPITISSVVISET